MPTAAVTITPGAAPIGMFDSGVGGLTVAATVKRLVPRERIVYFGDTARVPYGTKSPATIRRFSRQNAELLAAAGAKLLVVACNTSSAVGLDIITRHFPGPVIDVIRPAVAAAVATTRSHRIGVIGTPATIRSGIYPRLLRAAAPQAAVFSQACPLLVPLAEEGWLTGDVPFLVAAHYLQPLLQQEIDTLILGCTHYPLLLPVLRKVVGPYIQLVSSAEAAAAAVQATLRDRQLCATRSAGPDQYYCSDNLRSFQKYYDHIIGRKNAHFALAVAGE